MNVTKPLIALALVTSGLVVSVAPAVALAAAPDDGCAGFAKPDGAASADVTSFASIAREIQQNPDLSTFAELIDAAGLADELHSADESTVFAPTNAAFDAIPANVFESILADAELATSIAGYHVIAGDGVPSFALGEIGSANALNGDPLTFVADGETVSVNDHPLRCMEVLAGNGIIHIIDSVLMPPSAALGAPGTSAPGSSVAGFSAEQEAVAHAFETAVDSSLTYDEQAPFIEDAAELRATIENYPTAAEAVMGISAEVTSVAIDGDTAAITYVLSFNGVDAGYGELDGTMARIGGVWVVPHDEYCAFQAQARNGCAG